MPKLLVSGEWYDTVASESLYEKDYENLLLTHAAEIYPDFFLTKFKCYVESEHGGGYPDLALIDRKYRNWWVIEVELGHHSMKGHVERQVRVFSDARYTDKQAAVLASNDPRLRIKRLSEMMRGEQPRVLILVNEAKPEWAQALAPYDALVGVVEVFRSAHNEHILRINGTHPEPLADIVSVCRVDPAVPRMLIVNSPAALKLPDEGILKIEYEGAVSMWQRLTAKNLVWLTPRGKYPLPSGIREFLLQRAKGRLVFSPIKKR